MSDVCHRISSMVSPLIDGALDNASTIEVEEHVAACANCQERLTFAQAMKVSVKRGAQASVPSDARARMLRAMQAASQSGEADVAATTALAVVDVVETAPLVVDAEESNVRTLSRGRRSMRAAGWTIAIAASVAFFVVPKIQRNKAHTPTLADIMAEHSRPLPPESNDPKAVRQFERYVGVPVRPMQFAQSRWVGGRVLPVQHERAAMMQYEVNRGGQAQRVSMFIYDPSRIRVESSNFEARAVGSSEVRVGHANGYSVAVTEREGVGYLVASDLDGDMSAEWLVNASDMQ
jgi:anti-sigma factor RsiW